MPNWVQKISLELIDKFIDEVRKPEHLEVFEMHILQPIIKHTFQHLYPYIIVTSIVFFLTFIVAVAILFMIIRTHYK
jgi:hypothetical protein